MEAWWAESNYHLLHLHRFNCSKLMNDRNPILMIRLCEVAVVNTRKYSGVGGERATRMHRSFYHSVELLALLNVLWLQKESEVEQIRCSSCMEWSQLWMIWGSDLFVFSFSFFVIQICTGWKQATARITIGYPPESEGPFLMAVYETGQINGPGSLWLFPHSLCNPVWKWI